MKNFIVAVFCFFAINSNAQINGNWSDSGNYDTNWFISGNNFTEPEDIKVYTSGNNIVIQTGGQSQDVAGSNNVRVYSLTGNLVAQHTLIDQTTRIQINRGIYIVVVYTANETKVFKIVL